MTNCDTVEGQLNAIMEALAKSAVVEISKLFRDIIVVLRLEISESRRENQELKRKLMGMRSDLKTEPADVEGGPSLIKVESCEEVWGGSDAHTQLDSRPERAGAGDLGCSHWVSSPAKAPPAEGAGELSEDDDWGGDAEDSHCSDTTEKDPESLTPPPQPRRCPAAEEGAESGSFPCAQCGKNFSRRDYLKIHQRHHTREKLFPCAQCQRTFVCRNHLKQHLLTHSGLKPFRCATCGREFSRKYHLQEHQKTHSDARPHACGVCGKGFKQLSTLKVHQRRHRGQPFSCVCGKSFSTKHVLKLHQMIHTGERPYSCEQCGRSFTRRNNLRKHMRVHYEGLDTTAFGKASFV